jgi:hypothetical protein
MDFKKKEEDEDEDEGSGFSSIINGSTIIYERW